MNEQAKTFQSGERVRCDAQTIGLAAVYGKTGTVRETFADGTIVRVVWDFTVRRGRKNEPYVSDIGASALNRL